MFESTLKNIINKNNLKTPKSYVNTSSTSSLSNVFESTSNPVLVNLSSNSLNSFSSNKLEFLERNIRWQLSERGLKETKQK